MTFNSIQIEEEQYALSNLVYELGRIVTLRDTTLVNGSNPYPNPPVNSGLVVSGTNASGASSINLRATNVNGRVIAGDEFLLGTDAQVYTATGAVQSSSNAFASIPITPDLAVTHSDGEAVVPTWDADTSLLALVTSFPAFMVNDTSIQVTDKQVRFIASLISFTPTDTMKMFIGSDQYSIITVKAIECQGITYGWTCHCRR